MDSIQGPYANADKAPLFVQRCRCPLYCPTHGEDGPIPGDMKSPAQHWTGTTAATEMPTNSIQLSQPAAPTIVETTALGPAPINSDGVIGNGVTQINNWVPEQAPITNIEVHTTPASIIPVQITDAVEQLLAAGIKITQENETILVNVGDNSVGFNFELANCVAQEILNTRKRIELTLPETLETTLEAAKKRLGPDMAPLVDLIIKALDNKE